MRLTHRRTIFALLIVVTSAVGLVAYAYSLALQNNPPSSENPCALPSRATSYYSAFLFGVPSYASNVTFTDKDQSVNLPGATFTVTPIADPSIQQLVNGQCAYVGDPNRMATIQVRVDYKNGNPSDTLTLNYKGNLSGEQRSNESSSTHPSSRLLWQPGTDYIIVIVSKS